MWLLRAGLKIDEQLIVALVREFFRWKPIRLPQLYLRRFVLACTSLGWHKRGKEDETQIHGAHTSTYLSWKTCDSTKSFRLLGGSVASCCLPKTWSLITVFVWIEASSQHDFTSED